MCLMILLTNYLILIPSIDKLIAYLKLDKLLIELFKRRLIVLYPQRLIIHGRSIEPWLPRVNNYHQTVMIRLTIVRPPTMILDQLNQELLEHCFIVSCCLVDSLEGDRQHWHLGYVCLGRIGKKEFVEKLIFLCLIPPKYHLWDSWIFLYLFL